MDRLIWALAVLKHVSHDTTDTVSPRSFGDHLPRLFKPDDLSKTLRPRVRFSFHIYIFIENLSKCSCQKLLDCFGYNLAEIYLVTLVTLHVYEDCLSCHDMSEKWLQGGGLNFLFILKKKSSCQKLLDRFQYDLAECCFYYPVARFFRPS